MLTRSVYVRRIKQLENGEYATDPTGDIGEVLAKDVVPMPDETSPTGHSMVLMLTVEWENARHPALELVPAQLLENVSYLFDDEEEVIEGDEEESEEVEAEGTEEVQTA